MDRQDTLNSTAMLGEKGKGFEKKFLQFLRSDASARLRTRVIV